MAEGFFKKLFTRATWAAFVGTIQWVVRTLWDEIGPRPFGIFGLIAVAGYWVMDFFINLPWWISVLLAVAVFVVGMYLTALVFKNKTAMEMRFEPGAVCMHLNEGPHCTERMFCVIVKNNSRNTWLNGCHVDLISVEPFDHAYISMPLRTISNRDHFSLSRGQEDLISVASLKEPNWKPPNGQIDESEPYGKSQGSYRGRRQTYTQHGLPFDEEKNLIPEEIQLHYGMDTSKRYIPQGRYVIKLKAFSDKADPAEKDFLIDVVDGQLTFREATEADLVEG